MSGPKRVALWLLLFFGPYVIAYGINGWAGVGWALAISIAGLVTVGLNAIVGPRCQIVNVTGGDGYCRNCGDLAPDGRAPITKCAAGERR